MHTPSPSAPEASPHRLFAPGVRLFRRLRFGAKAVVISVAFGLPLLVLGVMGGRAQLEDVQAVRAEQDGLRLVGDVVQALREAGQVRALDIRQASGNTGAPKADTGGLDQSLQRISKWNSPFAAEAEVAAAVKGVVQARQALVGTSEGLVKVYAGHFKLSRALLKLNESVTDVSGLTLDPAADSYFAMDAGVVALPQLTDRIARLASLSAASSQEGKPNPVVEHELARVDALVDQDARRAGGSLAKIISAHPERAAELAPDAVLKQLEKLRDLATDSLGSGGAEQAKKIEQAGDATVAALWKHQALTVAALDQFLADRLAEKTRNGWLALAMVLACLLVAAYLFFSFYLVMHTGLRRVRQHLALIGAGDLSQSMKAEGSDEFAELQQNLVLTQQVLSGTLLAVQSAAEHMASTSEQLSDGTDDLARRTEATTAHLQSSASAVEQIHATVANTSASSRDAAALAAGNAELAKRGGEVIGQVVQTMQRIQASSNKIEQIIGTIDGIAFQTNILALNAAVEAARAGEAGRGFAVVAAEVRQLAQRSAGAAREIKGLIATSVSETQLGARVAGQAGETIDAIVGSAQRMNDALSGITAAAAEQANGVGLVSGSVSELDRMTRENTVLVEQTTAAAGSLRSDAAALAKETSRFKLSAA